MAKSMKDKFDKYWGQYSVTLALGCVLDPTSKLDFLSFSFRRLYPDDYQEKVERVKNGLYDLFNEYTNKMVASSSSLASSSRDTQSHSFAYPLCKSSIIEFCMSNSRHTIKKGEKKLQMMASLNLKYTWGEECLVGNDIDILQYWKLNKDRFPQLAIMACDILSIPITTVASESTFSIGGRILHRYRNCLLPETVQALICTRNWLHGFKEVGPCDVPNVKEIKLPAEPTSQGT